MDNMQLPHILKYLREIPKLIPRRLF